MKTKINFTEEEMQTIQHHGCICFAVAKNAMERSRLSFDDIERINNHYENHIWGTEADRKYRKQAINKAVNYVAANVLEFI